MRCPAPSPQPCDVDDEVRLPGHVQALNLQIPASLAAAGRNTAATVGAKARVVCDVSDSREEELVSALPIACSSRVLCASVEVVGVEALPKA
jgi:hypothetical protein